VIEDQKYQRNKILKKITNKKECRDDSTNFAQMFYKKLFVSLPVVKLN
jgi:hypothetical protein